MSSERLTIINGSGSRPTTTTTPTRSLNWGNLVIHLAKDDNSAAHMTSTLDIHVDDADELAADWREAGINVVDPENQEYGKREGRHTDPDGNVIRFGGPPT